jgi:hypothetical protein
VSWNRVESATIDPALVEGLEARTADPLWLMARQWQAGEFRGEDAASPLTMRVEARSVRLDELSIGNRTLPLTDPAGPPLEALVEAEPLRTGPAAARVAAELGQVLLGVLDRSDAGRQLAAHLRTTLPVSLPRDDGLDPVGRRRLELLARRSFEGSALATTLVDAAAAARIVADAGVTGENAERLVRLLTSWSTRCAAAFVEPGNSAWDPRRMEYSFELTGTASGARLTAHEYSGGDLRWSHFDVDPGPANSDDADVGERRVATILPIPLRYAGMPASRFWEFEESEVFFGGIEAGPTDLARIAVANYGISFGDDWYIAPLRVPSGSLTRIVAVEVIDDFGRTTTIEPAAVVDGPDRAFRFFELTGDDGPERGLAPVLAMPDTVDAVEAPRPLEDVRFVRDEMANMAWAVERRIEVATGRPVDLAARLPGALATAEAQPEAQPDDLWELRLWTGAPDNWVPLVPVRLGDDGAVMLQRGRMPVADGGTRGARGVILEPQRRLLVHEEEIPAEGLRVVRQFQEARTRAGRRFTWIGRRKGPGRGEGASGLLFDVLKRSP